MPQRFRALIAAPPGLMRRSLRAVLATFPEIDLIGEADGCLSALTMSQTLQPDILLLSADLPENEVTALLQKVGAFEGYRPRTVAFVNTLGQKRQILNAGAEAVLWQSDTTRKLSRILQRFQSSSTSSQT